jgi:uncharacterized protein YggU (UPF0235/DUF167 family)
MRLNVRVTTRSSKPRVEWDGNTLSVWVSAPPVDDAANDAVIKQVAQALQTAPSRIVIAKGGHSRHKAIDVAGMDDRELRDRLSSLIEGNSAP